MAQGPSWGREGRPAHSFPIWSLFCLPVFPTDFLENPRDPPVPASPAKWVLGIPTQALLLARISPVPIYLPLFIKYM